MESNVQAVQRAFQDFSRGNIPAILDACTDDVIWESYENPSVPFAGTFEGQEGVRRFFKILAEEVEYTALSPREFCVDGDNVIVLGRHIGKVKRTGRTFDHDWAMVFKLRSSKISSFFCFVDTRDQAEAFREGLEGQRREIIPDPRVASKR